MEKFLGRSIPLKEENIKLLSNETKNMIKANAIGIPVLAIIQGIVATIGYWIFGVQDFGLWGFLTGVFSMVPIVGTAVIWLPLTAYLFSIDKTGNAVGLLIYALVLITNIDYVVRLTLLKEVYGCSSAGHRIWGHFGNRPVWFLGRDLWAVADQLFYHFSEDLYE